MNKIIHYCLIGVLASACSQSSNIDEELPGNYIRDKNKETEKYSLLDEVLTIEKKDGQAENVFTVTSKSVTRQLDDNNQPLPAKEETESGTLTYDPEKKQLERQPNGNTYSVDVKKGIITNGTVTFRKVK